MLKSDADSGRSSCSASSGAAPLVRGQRRFTREASTNTELRVQDQPRIPVTHQLLSPARLFPANRQLITSSHHDIPQHFSGAPLTVAPRKGGLSNAVSSIDLVSSTQIDNLPPRLTQHDANGTTRRRTGVSRLKVRRQPVQRAASRLYRAGAGVQGKDSDMCVGPEFIVRATHPSKQLDITPAMHSGERRTVVVILLNGQKIDVTCDPSTATAGEVFQAIIQQERLEHNFMLGLSALVSGDFVFLPDEYKIRKVAPDTWCGSNTLKKKSAKKSINEENTSFSLFLRIKFFMPPNLSKVVRGGEWRNWVYLQLRRSIVEGQITLQLAQLIELTGYALQAEFGNYSQREHASGDYYVLEHYLPEGSIFEEETHIRSLMKQAHKNCENITVYEAKEKFISTVQIFKDYGSHFYSAIWATRDGFARDVWLSISPRGMILYSRNTCITALPRDTQIGNISSRILLQSLAWQHIHTLYYNKHTLYVIPSNRIIAGTVTKRSLKFKLKMDSNKSYFTFYLASLHHRFYMRLYADISSLLNISDEFSIPIEPNKIDKNSVKEECKNTAQIQQIENVWSEECSNFQDSYNLAVRGQFRIQKDKLKHNLIPDNYLEEIQNKENEMPCKTDGYRDKYYSTNNFSDHANASSTEVLSSPESCSLPRRLGVKMGTRAFNGSSHSTAYQHKQFHSLDTTHIDHIKQHTYPSERLVQSDIDLASTHSDSDEQYSYQKICNIDKMNILPQRNYSADMNKNPNSRDVPYIVESPQVNSNTFVYHPYNETLVDSSIQDKLNLLDCIQSERHFKTVSLVRDSNGALGMQVAEGSDGNIYVKSITPGGPADHLKQIYPGDQIISVNGQSLLNLNYNKALNMLQKAPSNVEIILLQSVSNNETAKSNNPIKNNFVEKKPLPPASIVAKLLHGSSLSKLSLYNKSDHCDSNSMPQNFYLTNATISSKQGSEQLNDDMLNVEALKTINILLALTKKNIEQKTSINTKNVERVQSTNTIIENIPDNINLYQYPSSVESSPSKSHVKNKMHSFNGMHEMKIVKKRPLSVHIPSNLDLFQTSESVENSFENGMSLRTRSCDNITVLKTSNNSLSCANSMYQLKLPQSNYMPCANEHALKYLSELPRNATFSRKWLGHAKYPVTPSKVTTLNVNETKNRNTADKLNNFIYKNSLSDEEQIFI